MIFISRIALLLSLIATSNAFSMAYVNDFYKWWYPEKQHECSNSTPLSEPLSADTPTCLVDGLTDYAWVPEMSDEQKKNYVAHGKTWQEMMEVFQDAPLDMHDIVSHLSVKQLDPEWRAAFILGPPGTGKTTASLAVPHRARWNWVLRSGPALAGQYRNEAKERLALDLARAVASKRKVVFIVDELNKLLENFDSKGHDSDITGSFLWTFLDEQKRNSNFFFIGTMNRDTKLPDQVKHRFGGSTIYFPAIEDPAKLCDIFKKVIARNDTIAFDDECDDAFFITCFNSMESEGISITPRDYENIRLHISRLTFRDDKTSAVRKIKKSHVTEAIKQLAKTYTRSQLGKESLTDEEWRDFNAVQSRIIEMKLQCCQKISMNAGIGSTCGVMMPSVSIGRPGGVDMNQAIGVIEQQFSSEQIAVYRRVMKIKDGEPLIRRDFIDQVKNVVTSAPSFIVQVAKSILGSQPQQLTNQ